MPAMMMATALSLGELARLADKLGEPERRSGKQELFESMINRYIR